MKTYAELAVGTRVAAHIPHLAGRLVIRAKSEYSAPMDDRLAVVLADPEYPETCTFCCVLKWPQDFTRPQPFKIKSPTPEPPRLPFRLKGRNA